MPQAVVRMTYDACRSSNDQAYALDAHLRTHLVESLLLRGDDFEGFFNARQAALLEGIQQAMGKRLDLNIPEAPEAEPVDYEPEDEAAS